MSVIVGVVFAISCVVAAVHGGCVAGPGQQLVTYDTEYNEPLKPPIRQVVRDVASQRVDCLEAVISPPLGKGTSTNPKTQAYAKKMGYPDDQAGHLVANILGGTGYRTYNIVPQSRKSNTSGAWRTQVERKIRDKVRDESVTATFIVEPQYSSNIPPVTRPYALKYSVSYSDGTSDSGTVDNPKP